uniref:SCP domain-containing protein n=1 Tax=Mesocestoides corti TaxID=53468 RepID=A0A5K3FSZ6_MESCO
MHSILCLLGLIGHVLAIVPSTQEREEIVAKFTHVRQNVNPPASNMNLLTYSEGLEKQAASYASRCLFQFPPPNMYPELVNTGMLLQITSNPKLRFQGVAYFAKQAKNYDYEGNSCKGGCRLYKQMVWAASTEVGCAKAKCPGKKRKEVHFMACAFNHGGTNLDERPYAKGVSCSNCRQGAVCLHNQCASAQEQNTTTLAT